jgi:hypothetical protein
MAEKTMIEKAGEAVGFGIAMAEDVAGTVKTAVGAAVTTVAAVLKKSPATRAPVKQVVKAFAKKAPKKAPAPKAIKKPVTKTAGKKSITKKAAKKVVAKKTRAKKAVKKTVKKAAPRRT